MAVLVPFYRVGEGVAEVQHPAQAFLSGVFCDNLPLDVGSRLYEGCQFIEVDLLA